MTILGTKKEKEQQNIAEKMQAAMKEGNDKQVIESLVDMQKSVSKQIMEDFEEFQLTQDKTILEKRGYRQLTSKEEKWYKGFIQAAKASNPQQAFADFINGPDGIMPETILTDVYKDLVLEHPLLTKINFINAKYMTKWIVNDHATDRAVWGKLNDKIVKEIKSSFEVIDLTQNKLSAFASVPNDMLDLGPTFIDAYVRMVLKEALACGIEQAIITGNGLNCPVGLDRDISNGVSYSTSTGYPKKSAQAITSFSPAEYGALISQMAVSESYTDEDSVKHGGKPRKFNSVLMIVNQVDYLTKVMPATTVQNLNGGYTPNVFPFPTEVIISNEIETGKAILCLPNEYVMAMGANKEGVVETSKEYQFLDDCTTYKIKTYGQGKAFDNTCSLLLDISGLEEAYIYTKVKGTVTTATA